MGCGCSGGGKRPATTVLVFVVKDGQGNVVAEEPSYHEARVHAGQLGPGFSTGTVRRRFEHAAE